MNAHDIEAQDLRARVQRLPDRERLGVMTQLLRSLPPALLVDAWIMALTEAAEAEDPLVNSSPAHLLRQSGAPAHDEHLPAMRTKIYEERGRPEVEDPVVDSSPAQWRLLVDAIGRVIQEAKHHHGGRGRSLREPGALPARLAEALAVLEQESDVRLELQRLQAEAARNEPRRPGFHGR